MRGQREARSDRMYVVFFLSFSSSHLEIKAKCSSKESDTESDNKKITGLAGLGWAGQWDE